MNHEYKKQVTDKYKNNSGKKRRREMMKVHREQKDKDIIKMTEHI